MRRLGENAAGPQCRPACVCRFCPHKPDSVRPLDCAFLNWSFCLRNALAWRQPESSASRAGAVFVRLTRRAGAVCRCGGERCEGPERRIRSVRGLRHRARDSPELVFVAGQARDSLDDVRTQQSRNGSRACGNPRFGKRGHGGKLRQDGRACMSYFAGAQSALLRQSKLPRIPRVNAFFCEALRGRRPPAPATPRSGPAPER